MSLVLLAVGSIIMIAVFTVYGQKCVHVHKCVHTGGWQCKWYWLKKQIKILSHSPIDVLKPESLPWE